VTEQALQGSCLCGAVRFEVDPPFDKMVHCHCARCRKATGTGHATNLYLQPSQLRWLAGTDLIGRYDLPAAKSFSKWFCRRCGSPVPRITRSGRTLVLPAGSLDVAPPISPSCHIFWDSRVAWGCTSSGLPTHAEYPDDW
jgi:hypothetical protein